MRPSILTDPRLRIVPSVEVRKSTRANGAAGESEVTQLAGYGAMFKRETVIGGWFREMIMPGAFASVIGKGSDVRGTYNHEVVLGRTIADTMRLVEDETGLQYVIDLNADDPQAIGIASRVARRDVTGSSFGFRVKRDEWVKPDDDSTDLELRIIHEFAELIDVGPVDFPAYDDTSAEARALLANETTLPASVRARIEARVGARSAQTPLEPRAGRVLSAANEQKLTQARDLIDAVVTQVTEGNAQQRPGVAQRDATSAGEEAAELVQYQAMAALLAQCDAACASMRDTIQALITAEAETPTETADEDAAEDAIECARFESLLAFCAQCYGACAGIQQLATALLAEHDEDDDPAMGSMSELNDADRARWLRLAQARAAR